MSNILDSILHSHIVQTLEKDATGVEQTVSKTVNALHSVTFMANPTTPHTLTFTPPSAVVTVIDDVKNLIGDGTNMYRLFTDAESAVTAFLNGKV